MGTLCAADHLSHLTRGRGLTWIELYKQPAAVNGLMNMRSLNSLVTDSSAASSSWGSGSRIVNGMVNILPNGKKLKPLYSLFAEQGWKRGLVTTTEITHATPAGFAASGLKRDAADPIAVQYLDRKVDVMLGGGRDKFDPAKRKDKKNVAKDFQTAEYVVMNKAAELEKAPLDKRWLGTFASGHLPFTLDRQTEEKHRTNVPTLATMTRRSLEWLEQHPNFILQVEGGRVDHGCHGCDAASAFFDHIAFDEAVDVALAFQQRHPDTLVVMTTDHGNGNPGLNGMGDKYGASSTLFANFKKTRRSFEYMQPKLEKAPNLAAMREIIYEGTGYKAPYDKLLALMPYLQSVGSSMYDSLNSASAQMGQLMGNHYGIGWSSGSHTSDYVPVMATGPGAEEFRGFIQNTDVFPAYLSFAGIDFRNPTQPLMAECGPSADETEAAAEA